MSLMEDKEIAEDELSYELKDAINNARRTFTSCAMSTIRWIQRYSHCYSFVCSFICCPLWILILPVAFALDICVYFIVSIVFIITFVMFLLIAPCQLSQKFSSCTNAWKPSNIYQYSLIKALGLSETIFVFFHIFWSCYCGTGEIDNGAPMCCIYFCSPNCHRACHQATHVQINDHFCIIL